VNARGVLVKNISPAADAKMINDFFAFCGKIESLSLQAAEGGAQESVVVFETESAAKTALLLTNAVIVDRSITVEPLPDAHAAPPAAAQMSAADIQQKPFAVDYAQRSKTSVIASLIAAGYSVGTDTLSKAKEYDEKHMITLQLKAGAENIKAKAKEIDETYKISETVQAGVNKVSDTAKAVDQRFAISSTANAAITTVTSTASAGAQVVAAKAMSNPTVANAVQKVQEKTAAATAAVKSQYNQLTTEATSEIEKRKAAKADSAAAAANAATPDGLTAAVAEPAAADAPSAPPADGNAN